MHLMNIISILVIYFISTTSADNTCGIEAAINYLKYVEEGTEITGTGQPNETQVSFQFLFKVAKSDNITDMPEFVNSRLTFNILEENGETLCVSLTGLYIKKETAKMSENTGAARIESHKCYHFLKNFPEMEIIATFNKENTVGVIKVNSTCWELKKSKECISELKIIEDLKSGLDYSKNPISQDFWNKVNELFVKQYSGVMDKFHIKFDDGPHNVIASWLLYMLREGFREGKEKVEREEDLVAIYDFRLSSKNWMNFTAEFIPHLTHIRSLDLRGNGIEFIDPVILNRSPNLTALYLGKNKLAEVPRPILENLTKLEILDLSHNRFSNIEELLSYENMSKFSKLKFLNLSYTNINIDEYKQLETFLAKCIHFEILDLSHCKLKDLSKYPDIFKYQERLEYLNLSHNELMTSPGLRFNNIIRLKHIDLSFNNFTKPLNMISSGNVEFLDLSANNIIFWDKSDDHSDNAFKNIKMIDMRLNNILIITEYMGETLEELHSVDIGDNPFNCDNCSLPEFQTWLLKSKNKDFHLLYNNHEICGDNIKCAEPSKKKGTKIIDAEPDPELCKEENLVPFIAITVVSVLSLILFGAVLVYVYRYELKDLTHLKKIKPKPKEDSTDYIQGRYKYDAFVCYSGDDRDWVIGELLPTLENSDEKYKLCLHERDFALGAILIKCIIEAIENSRRTIVVLTEGFINSQWCAWELEIISNKLFAENRDFLILVELERLDRSKLSDHLKFLMDTRTFLEWPNSNDIQRVNPNHVIWKRLKAALGKSLFQVSLEKAQEDQAGQEDQENEDSLVQVTKL